MSPNLQSIWNTLIPSRHALPNDIDDYDDNEYEEEGDDDEDDDLSPVPFESKETNHTF